jgi:hypothetical protein
MKERKRRRRRRRKKIGKRKIMNEAKEVEQRANKLKVCFWLRRLG